MKQHISPIEWLASDELGFTDLDQDHQTLVDLINGLIAAVMEEDRSACQSWAHNFAEALRLHFTREERFLLEIGYSHLDKHRTHHQVLLDAALAFNRLCIANENFDVLGSFLDEIKNALLEDIRGGDHYFVNFLETNGLDKTVKDKLHA